jgi:hypothetical protein
MASRTGILLPALCSFSLCGCASVTVTPLDQKGQPNGEFSGIRYYMPKPYLLVTEIPNDQLPKPEKGGAGAPAPGDTADKQGTKSDSPSSSSDLSYQLSNTSYSLKLIYLPDMSKTMAINISPSILGTSSVQPTLQDGWMLTSLQASSDNTKALSDLTTLAGALLGGGAKGATKTAKGGGGGGARGLPPGLYEFQYDQQHGYLTGLCAVTLFENESIDPIRFCPSLESIATMKAIRVKY